MTQRFIIHPENPQMRLIQQVVARLEAGEVMVYPTDSCYALGCLIGLKKPVERIRNLKKLDEKHELSLLCSGLSMLSEFASFDNRTFRLLKQYTPGPYTFILQAKREVPKHLLAKGQKTIGVRIPEHPITQALISLLDRPLLSTTAWMPDTDKPLTSPDDIYDTLAYEVDFIIDAGMGGMESSTMVDLTGDTPVILRVGKGDPSPFE